MKRILLCLMAVLLLAAGCGLPVWANEEGGTLTIQLQESSQDNSRANVRFCIRQAAALKDGYLQPVAAAKELDVDWDQLDTGTKVQEAIDLLVPLDLEGIDVKTDAQGTAVADGLEAGLYLVTPMGENRYDQLFPLLVKLPAEDPETGKMSMHVTVQPKHLPWPELTVEKVDAKTKEAITSDKAVFGVYEDKDGQYLYLLKKTGKDGRFTFQVRQPELWLLELDAPQGYELDDKPFRIEWKEGKLFADGKETSLLQVENERMPEIVEEGGQEETPAAPETPDTSAPSVPTQSAPSQSAPVRPVSGSVATAVQTSVGFLAAAAGLSAGMWFWVKKKH